MIMSPATIVIRPAAGLFDLELGELWQYRELLFFMTWRDIKVRYKQTLLGASWAVLQPLLAMVVFSLVFGRFAKLPSDGIPYPVFSFAGIIPWTFFSQGVLRGSTSLVSNSHILKKVFFPRLVLPISAVLAPGVDLVLSTGVLLVLMAWYGVPLHGAALAFPGLVLLSALLALAVTLWLAPLNVRFRDVGQAIPFILQLWMFLSPVAYSSRVVPERFRLALALNPMVGIIDGIRWSLVGKGSIDARALALSTVSILVLLLAGLVAFRRMEHSFRDVL